MNPGLPEGYFWDEHLKISDVPPRLTLQLWPNYMVEESDIKEDEISFDMAAEEFNRRFPVWGIRDKDKKLVAYVAAVQLYVDFSKGTLPDEGWSFAANSYIDQTTPNCICLLAANVDTDLRKTGIAEALIQKAKFETSKLGFKKIIAPVRPTLKHRFPMMGMEDYILKRSESGEIFDPWIQVHCQHGATILNVCSRSVVVKATLPKWTQWTGLRFEKSGEHVIPKALAPLSVDISKNLGVYCEPNVWVQYDL